jgi:TetR/AcrR family transcriptional repressor of nem operon
MLPLDTNVRDMITYRPIGQMAQQQDSRQRLVQAALKVFSSHGYHHTSIADILRESGCKKGTLYHYFSSKEELGYAAIDEQFRLLGELGVASHLRTNEHPIDRLVNVVNALPNVTGLGTLSSTTTDIAVRMASVHEGFRKHLAKRLEAEIAQLEGVVRSGVADGQITESVKPDQLAHLIATVGAGSRVGNLLWSREVIWKDALSWLKDHLDSLRM